MHEPASESSAGARIVHLYYGRGDTQPVELYDYLSAVWRRKWLVLLAMLVAGALAVLLALWLPSIYRAEAVLLPVEQEQMPELGGLASQFSGLATLAGINVSVGSNKEEALAMLTSRGFIENFVADRNLLPVLFADEWNSDSGEWTVEDADEIPTPFDAYKLFRDDLLKVDDDFNGLVRFAIQWKDPVEAAAWVNEMVARVNEVMRQRAIEEADQTIAALEAELESTNVVELRQAIFRLAEAQIQERILARVRDEYSFRVIDAAQPPDEDQHIKPNRPLLVVAGLLGGLVAGVALALFLQLLAQARAERELAES